MSRHRLELADWQVSFLDGLAKDAIERERAADVAAPPMTADDTIRQARALVDRLVDLLEYHDQITRPDERRCRTCGCTDERACLPSCSWVAEDLCSACAALPAPGFLQEYFARTERAGPPT